MHYTLTAIAGFAFLPLTIASNASSFAGMLAGGVQVIHHHFRRLQAVARDAHADALIPRNPARSGSA